MNPLAKMLIDMAKFYDQSLDDRQLEMYVEVLGKAPLDLVLRAGRDYVADTRNTRFPMPPHKILDRYIPREADSKDIGREVALRIREAVTAFGWCNATRAHEFIGETGWRVVGQMGGWFHICENLGVEIQETTFMAQCRDAVESAHRLEQQGFNPSRPAVEQGKRSGELAPMSFAELLSPEERP